MGRVTVTRVPHMGTVALEKRLNVKSKYVDSDYFGNDPKIKINRTLKPTSKENATLEAERGETIVTNLQQEGIPEFYTIGGKKHSRGGTFLNVPKDSFIFSQNNDFKIRDPHVLEAFGKSGKALKKGFVPAELSKTYDLNEYREVLANPFSDTLQRETAEMMIQNYNLKLGQLALVQESMKGFDKGVPLIAQSYLEQMGIDPSSILPEEQMQQELQQFKDGGQTDPLLKKKSSKTDKTKVIIRKQPNLEMLGVHGKANGVLKRKNYVPVYNTPHGDYDENGMPFNGTQSLYYPLVSETVDYTPQLAPDADLWDRLHLGLTKESEANMRAIDTRLNKRGVALYHAAKTKAEKNAILHDPNNVEFININRGAGNSKTYSTNPKSQTYLPTTKDTLAKYLNVNAFDEQGQPALYGKSFDGGGDINEGEDIPTGENVLVPTRTIEFRKDIGPTTEDFVNKTSTLRVKEPFHHVEESEDPNVRAGVKKYVADFFGNNPEHIITTYDSNAIAEQADGGQLNPQWENTKDQIAKTNPYAGFFRGIEKTGTQMGIPQEIMDPAGSMMSFGKGGQAATGVFDGIHGFAQMLEASQGDQSKALKAGDLTTADSMFTSSTGDKGINHINPTGIQGSMPAPVQFNGQSVVFEEGGDVKKVRISVLPKAEYGMPDVDPTVDDTEENTEENTEETVYHYDPEAEDYDESKVKKGDYVLQPNGGYKIMAGYEDDPWSGPSYDDENLGDYNSDFSFLNDKLSNDPELQKIIAAETRKDLKNTTPTAHLTQAMIDEAVNLSDAELIQKFLNQTRYNFAVDNYYKGLKNYDANAKLDHDTKEADNIINEMYGTGDNKAETDAMSIASAEAVYRSMNLLKKDPEYQKLLEDIDLVQVGNDDEDADNSMGNKRISKTDGWAGDTFRGQLALNKSKRLKLVDPPEEPSIKKDPPEVKHFKDSPVHKPGEWWKQDLVTMSNAATDYLSAKKYDPWQPSLNFEEAQPEFVDFRGNAARLGASGTSLAEQLAMVSGPQSLASLQNNIQRNQVDGLLKLQEQENKTNVGTQNQFELFNTQAKNAFNKQEFDNNVGLWDKQTIANQQFDNTKRALRWNMTNAFNNGWTNKGKTQAMNSLQEQYDIDPRTGYLYHTGVEGLVDGKQTKDIDIATRVNEIMKLNPNINSDAASRIAIKELTVNKTKKAPLNYEDLSGTYPK